MEIKTISVTYNRKVSDGNYGSIEVGATAWADLDEAERTPEGAAQAMNSLGEIIRTNVRKRALALLQDDRPKKTATKESLPAPAPPEEEFP